MKVLIIEDDLFYRKVYAKKFEIAGYQVSIAENGQEGITLAQKVLPDVILTDLMMPKMDGFQVLDTLKADPNLKNIPVIVLTNLSTAEDAEKVIQKGAVDVLVKSDSEPQTIIDRVQEIVKKEIN